MRQASVLPRFSFYSWLQHHRNRDDAVGDLARDARADDRFPRTSKWHPHPFGKARFQRYLYRHYACDGALAAFETAWGEYLRSSDHHVTR